MLKQNFKLKILNLQTTLISLCFLINFKFPIELFIENSWTFGYLVNHVGLFDHLGKGDGHYSKDNNHNTLMISL